MSRPAAAPSPGVQIGATKVELAVRTVLLSRNGSFGSELPQRVAVDAEVVGRVPRVEPLALLGRRDLGAYGTRETLGDPLCELIDQRVEESAGFGLGAEMIRTN